jgi:hypothetical protein
MVADRMRVTIDAVVIIIIIIYLVFTNFLIGSQVYLILVLAKYCFIFLINRLKCIGIIKLRLRNVSIMLLLQIRSDGLIN